MLTENYLELRDFTVQSIILVFEKKSCRVFHEYALYHLLKKYNVHSSFAIFEIFQIFYYERVAIMTDQNGIVSLRMKPCTKEYLQNDPEMWWSRHGVCSEYLRSKENRHKHAKFLLEYRSRWYSEAFPNRQMWRIMALKYVTKQRIPLPFLKTTLCGLHLCKMETTHESSFCWDHRSVQENINEFLKVHLVCDLVHEVFDFLIY